MGNDGPGRKPKVSDEEILVLFEEADDPVLKTAEIAEKLPIGRRAVYDRLRALEEAGVLKSKKTGARGAVWWYPGHTETTDS
ncbi:MAG: HTH domain-containing protein [Halobacteriaceae archaeon]